MYSAEATYQEDVVIVRKGSVTNTNPAPYSRGKVLRAYRNDRNIVSEGGIVLQDCVFASVSAAARFVSGRSENGYTSWKVGDETLDKWMTDRGLRDKKCRHREKKG